MNVEKLQNLLSEFFFASSPVEEWADENATRLKKAELDIIEFIEDEKEKSFEIGCWNATLEDY